MTGSPLRSWRSATSHAFTPEALKRQRCPRRAPDPYQEVAKRLPICGMEDKRSLELVPDDDLLRRLVEILGQSRRVEADLVALIGEVDARRLYAREASPSMFAFCTETLHLSEAAAYLRIAAARASRKHPVLLTMLASGRLHVTAIAKLAPHLTPENRDRLLERAVHRTKRQVEELVAEVAPRPDVPARVRKLPQGGSATAATPSTLASPGTPTDPATSADPLTSAGPGPLSSAGPANSASPATSDTRMGLLPVSAVSFEGEQRPGEAEASQSELRPDAVRGSRAHLSPGRGAPPGALEPLAPGRYKVQFTAGAELRDKLDRLRALMRSSVPDGDLAAIIDAAVTEKLERLEARRFGRTKAPRGVSPAAQEAPSSRHVPAAVRRAVYERDGGRCRYVDDQGRRCTAREGLEFHHRHPFALGGRHSVDGMALLCRTHNGLLAEIDFGREALARHRRSNAASRTPTAKPQALFSP